MFLLYIIDIIYILLNFIKFNFLFIIYNNSINKIGGNNNNENDFKLYKKYKYKYLQLKNNMKNN